MTGWKSLTHDFRPPVQGGEPIFTGQYPFTLPTVSLDTSESECGTRGGWHFCRSMADCFRIAGMWRTGQPNALIAVEPIGEVVERGNKCRAASLTLLHHATDDEIRTGLLEFSACFGAHQAAMAEEQWLWYQALGRPKRDRVAVIAGLELALEARGLRWTLKEFPTAWASRDARDALTFQFAARSAWISQHSDILTVGIRDAYRNGLGIAAPIAGNQIGWAMA